MLEKELEHLNTKIENPVLVVDLLRDIVVESTFPNVPRLLITYLLMPHREEESSVISCEYRRKNITIETIIIFELYCIDHNYSVKHIETVSFCRYFLFRNVTRLYFIISTPFFYKNLFHKNCKAQNFLKK